MEQKKFTTSFLGKEYVTYYIKDKTLALKALKKLMQSDELFGIDIETFANPEFKSLKDAALSAHTSSPRLIQIYDSETEIVYIFDCLTISDNQIFIEFLEAKQFVAHYATFELSFFTVMGVKDMNIGCSLLAAKIILQATIPEENTMSLSLESLVAEIYKVKIPKMMQSSDWGVPDLTFEQIRYAGLDSILTYKLVERLAIRLRQLKLQQIYKLIKEVQHPVVAMQLNGLLIDLDAHKKLMEVWRDTLFKSRRQVLDITQLEAVSAKKISDYLIKNLDEDTINSWPRTLSGQLSTSWETIKEYENIPVVTPFSEYKDQEKMLSSFGQKLRDMINVKTKRLHPKFNISEARTGRFSSSNPNCQQFPNDPTFRNLIIAPEGKVLVCADYSQIEIRIAAHVSQDERMLYSFQNGIDLHKLTASNILNKPIGEVTPQERKLCKTISLGLQFGLGAAKFARTLKKDFGMDMSIEDTKKLINQYFTIYPGFRAWQQAQTCDEELYAYTPLGKQRALTEKGAYGGKLNTPIQGGAAECMMKSLVFLHKIFKDTDTKLLATIHDEVILETPKFMAQETIDKVNSCMTEGFLNIYEGGITNGLVDGKSGRTWGEAK